MKKRPAVVENARRQAERYLGKRRSEAWPDYSIPLPKTVMPPRHPNTNWPYWTALGAELRMELEALAYGFAVTDDRRFLESARTLLVSLSEWERWTDADSCTKGKDPCLDTYFLTAGAAIAYDYLYPALSDEERAKIRQAIVEKGLRFIYSRAGAADSFVQRPERWPNGFAMVHAALGLGSLAVRGEDPEASRYLDCAIEKAGLFLRDFANPDGGLIEGFYYGAASVDPLALFFSALKKNTGVNLFTHPYFRRAHEFPLYFMIPGKAWLAGFGDSGGPPGEQPLFQGSLGLLAKEGLASGAALWYLEQAVKTKEVEPSCLETIQRWVFYALRRTSPARDTLVAGPAGAQAAAPDSLPHAREFPSIGWVALRSGWRQDDDLLAFHSGPSVGHSHLDQNSFILASHGEVVASDPGYQRFDMNYPDGRDREVTHQEHLFTKGSAGHNVILVDGHGQVKAGGRLGEFFQSRAFAYTAGEAADAYPALSRFTRHILHVEQPSYFLILDEIRTDGRARKIEWLLQTQPRGRFEIFHPREVGVVVGGAAMTVRTLIPASAAWQEKNFPQQQRFGRTAAISTEGAELRFVSVIQTHAAGERPGLQSSLREVAGGLLVEHGADTILLRTAERGSVQGAGLLTDGKVAFVRRQSAVTAYALVEGSIVADGERRLLVASAPVDAAWSGEEVEVQAKTPVTLSCYVPGFRAIEAVKLTAGRHKMTLARDEALPRRVMVNQLRHVLEGFDHAQAGGDAWRAVRIATPAEWEVRRKDIRQRVLDIMGAFPATHRSLDARVVSEEDTAAYTRRKVTYLAADGDRIPAWLLFPKKGHPPWPAVLALHQTEVIGKDSAVAIGGAPHVRYGHELAERGFVVLAPDSITAGERVLPGSKPYVTEVFDRAHPEWSAMGKMCSDHRRGIDYLQSLDFVDHDRIGVIGHSLGGYNSFFLAAFDERIRACVTSCGFTTMGRASKPLAWSRASWFVHFPRLAPYLRAGILPFDMHEVMALAAPRPLFNYSARKDSIFPDAETIAEAGGQVREVYRLLGAEDRLVFQMGDGPHNFPLPVREQAYAWLARELSAW